MSGRGERARRAMPSLNEAIAVHHDARGIELARAGQGFDRVEQVPRRDVLGAPSQVAAREAEHAIAGRRGQRRQQPAVVGGRAIGAQRELAGEHAALEVAQQRVVARRGREHALGEPAHEEPVEIGAEREADRTDEHALTEATDAFARAPRARAPACSGTHRASAPPRPRRVRRAGRAPPPRDARPPARRRATSRAGCRRRSNGEPAGAPSATFADHDFGTRVVSRSPASASTNARSRATSSRSHIRYSSRRDLRGVRVEQQMPLVEPADHTRAARHPLPPRARRGPTLAVEERDRGEQREQRVASEAVVGQGEQPEQRAAEHRVVERAHRNAVVRDPGELELLVHEARVRVLAGEQDGHPLQRHAVPHRVDHAPHDRAHLFVGIGRRDDRRAGRRDDGAIRRDVASERARRGERIGIGARDAGQTEHAHRRCALRNRAQELRRRASEPLREIRHDDAELVDRDRTVARRDRSRPP